MMKRPMETSIVGTGLAALLAVITAGQRERHPAMIRLGRKRYNEQRISTNGTQSCGFGAVPLPVTDVQVART